MNNNFFQEQREQSSVKTRIVAKYFSAWANVIVNTQKKRPNTTQKMAYIDLFSGAGKYGDDNKSTPILVLETILKSEDLSERMITMFNDKDSKSIESLKSAVSQIEGIENLKYPPIFFNKEVGEDIAKIFDNTTLVPTLFFVDPWGYKGLSLELIASIVKDWGCDCVFFFNYNRISIGLNNPIVDVHMKSIFGSRRLAAIRKKYSNATTSAEREKIIVDGLCGALKKNGCDFVLPFRFMDEKYARISHHLIFVSKKFRGYEIMKEIMCRESVDFEYNPRSLEGSQQSSIDKLRRTLLRKYKGQTIDFLELYESHSVGKPYIKRNYKEALKALYESKKITAVHIKTGKPPRKGTFSDEMRITFGGKQ